MTPETADTDVEMAEEPELPPEDRLNQIAVYYGQAKGLKEGNCEDRVIAKFSATSGLCGRQVDCVVVGVLDGHGGSACVDYIQQQLPVSIKGELSSLLLEKLPATDEIQSCMRRAFYNADSNFLYVAKRNNDNSGTTAATCVFYSHRDDPSSLRVQLGGVGDSRAVLFRLDPLSQRILPVAANPVHRPAIPAEKRRVESMGGQVLNIQGIDRVVLRVGQGMIGLAVSRAFGDLLMKEPKPVVSAVPEFSNIPLDLDLDQFIVIGTDGIFDFVQVELIGQIVAKAPRTQAGMKKAIDQIIAIARSNGSSDDRTCLVVDFHWANRATSSNSENRDISNVQ